MLSAFLVAQMNRQPPRERLPFLLLVPDDFPVVFDQNYGWLTWMEWLPRGTDAKAVGCPIDG
jgi:hypothetical protein